MNEYLSILAFVFAGLVWNNIGYLSAWRKYRNSDDWEGFDKRKLRDDLILGLILGVCAYLLGVYQGDLVDIYSIQTFLAVIVGGFTAIAFVDKLIVGGILSK